MTAAQTLESQYLMSDSHEYVKKVVFPKTSSFSSKYHVSGIETDKLSLKNPDN